MLDVIDPANGPNEDALWLGRWDMDFDGHHGELVIRRTRTVPEPNTLARIGSFYEDSGLARPVTGFIDISNNNLNFYIDFNNTSPNDGPWDLSTPITLTGQYFRAQIFNAPDNDYTHGNFAAGYTLYGDKKDGLLLSREQINLARPAASSFDKKDWVNDYRLYYADGNEAEFNISSIASSTSANDVYPDPFYAVFAKYYPIEGTPRGLGPNQGILGGHTSQMFFENELNHTDLFFHTWEKNIISGVGVFGIPAPLSDDNDDNNACFIGSALKKSAIW